MTPTTVRLADGSTYTIPAYGEWGSFTWARQASLIAVAYRQVGSESQAVRWDTEYQRRLNVWRAIEAGKDLGGLGITFGKDLLTAPVKILATIGTTALDLGDKATRPVFRLADVLSSPWFYAGVGLVLVVVVVKLAPAATKLAGQRL